MSFLIICFEAQLREHSPDVLDPTHVSSYLNPLTPYSIFNEEYKSSIIREYFIEWNADGYLSCAELNNHIYRDIYTDYAAPVRVRIMILCHYTTTEREV